jgi:hypothetical protein
MFFVGDATTKPPAYEEFRAQLLERHYMDTMFPGATLTRNSYSTIIERWTMNLADSIAREVVRHCRRERYKAPLGVIQLTHVARDLGCSWWTKNEFTRARLLRRVNSALQQQL